MQLGSLAYCQSITPSYKRLFVGFSLIGFGLFSFFKTLLGDPGIPKEVYNMKIDPSTRPWHLPDTNAEGQRLCYECYIYLNENRKHCHICDVCIDGWHHHCMFYGKCIGAGNILYFKLSLVAFLSNVFFIILCQLWVIFSHSKVEL